MGLLGFLRGDSNSAAIAPVNGQKNQLDANSVHTKSAPNAITPDSPGSWDKFRYAPVVEQARVFSEEEAQALQERARDAKLTTRATKKAYTALKSMSDDHTQVNKWHEFYRRNEGRNERRMQGYANTSARYLHSQRPGYAKLGHSLKQAEQAADSAIAALAATL
ncbi:hypothetical protein [Roseofilum casamattae]|uniref:Uncharacterized protein n=1 Tax=Roseofilum casamattae BLCC-M143 TaxID=3022442 RepID=A0ABT7C1F3_9CYAN|nr:hypothetical protein [Roseofilum casamattae]MDJ1185259.1 hypothetical protein [Roseofilum casamattae BLCC-M143]